MILFFAKNAKKEILDNSAYCNWCGKPTSRQYYGNKKRRGNGSGSAQKISVNNYKAIVVIGYKDNPKYPGDKSKRLPVRRTKNGFKTKTEALAYIPTLKHEKVVEKKITLKALYDKWKPTYNKSKKDFRRLWLCF